MKINIEKQQSDKEIFVKVAGEIDAYTAPEASRRASAAFGRKS